MTVSTLILPPPDTTATRCRAALEAELLVVGREVKLLLHSSHPGAPRTAEALLRLAANMRAQLDVIDGREVAL